MQNRIVIKGGRVIDPGHLDDVRDVVIRNGLIEDIPDSRPMSSEPADVLCVNATGKIVAPGFIDMHVHLREPGFEYKETIVSGCHAAAYGGFTAVCPMPNTKPVCDRKAVVDLMLEKATTAAVPIFPVAAITRNLKGESLCEFEELKEAGAVAVSDDGNPVVNNRLMRRALEQAGRTGLTVISHCEYPDLAAGGIMNEGSLSAQINVQGIPNVAESIMVMRDIALSEMTGVPVHIAHVSTRESVRAIREAKQKEIPVTAETAPHYFTLTEDAVTKYYGNAKMNPPLRTDRDRAAVREGLADDTIDVIASDHAPHSVDEKEAGLEEAPNGIIGLETSIPLSLKLVEKGILTLEGMITAMSTRPAKIVGLYRGIQKGREADLTIIDPDLKHRIEAEHFQSLSRNTPFDGWEMQGKAVMTIVRGKIVFEDKPFARM